jgi:NAD(P)-dependent dehydrogenase (short-subunit alcohol dehydrogenase family)
LGLKTCQQLASHGATVYLAARSEEKGAKTIEALRDEKGNKNIELLLLDLADIKEVSLAACNGMARSYS